jgi:hypothetical protein
MPVSVQGRCFMRLPCSIIIFTFTWKLMMQTGISGDILLTSSEVFSKKFGTFFDELCLIELIGTVHISHY